MMLLGLQGCTRIDGPFGTPSCTPPPGEEQLLADYRSQTVLGLLPAVTVTDDLNAPFVRRYCDSVGTDTLQYANETSIRVMDAFTGYFTAEKLLSIYAPAATPSGWRLLSQADGWNSRGLTIVEGGVRMGVETGLLFCKTIDGTTTDFVVDSNSRPDYPDRLAEFDLRIFSRRDAPSCASST
jgi:hypothetical protein